VNLFRTGNFRLHGGGTTNFKIDCDALTDDDLASLAMIGASILPPFGTVVGVPTGGTRLAEAMTGWVDADSKTVLLVDDVLTTGGSMEDALAYWLRRQTAGESFEVEGFVIFARGPIAPWITPLFTLRESLWT